MIGSVLRWKELERWVPFHNGPEISFEHSLAPLEDLLSPRIEKLVFKDHLAEWSPITIHFDGSIVPRNRKEPFKGAMFAAYPGDIIFSKIDARNGALGIIPQSLSKVVVTSEYPVHVPDTEIVDPEYLSLILRTKEFLRVIKSNTSGTSGRKRITPENFRTISIPLPEREIQTTLIKQYTSKLIEAAKLEEEAKLSLRRGEKQFEAALGLTPPPDLPKRLFQIAHYRKIEKWSHEGILHADLATNSQIETEFPLVTLGEIAKVSYGIQKCPTNRPSKHARPYLRVANVQRGYLDLREIKMINVPDKEMPKLRLQYGDILLCEGNSADLVGRGAIWRDEIQNCVHQNHVLRVRVENNDALPEFILAFINSSFGQAYFRSKAKRTTNLASINSTEVSEMPLPLPDLDFQKSVLLNLHSSHDEVNKLVKKAAHIRKSAWEEFNASIFS
jgi:type I restriction enzyme, S subunit